MWFWRWSTMYDAGTTLKQLRVNVTRLLGDAVDMCSARVRPGSVDRAISLHFHQGHMDHAADIGRRRIIGLLLGHRRRWWANSKPTLGQRLMLVADKDNLLCLRQKAKEKGLQTKQWPSVKEVRRLRCACSVWNPPQNRWIFVDANNTWILLDLHYNFFCLCMREKILQNKWSLTKLCLINPFNLTVFINIKFCQTFVRLSA